MASSGVKKNPIYDSCDIPKPKLDFTVDEEIAREIGRNFRTLPSFESKLYETVFIRYYSLKSNENLKCCWHKYLDNIGSRVYAPEPFQFPDLRDLHFYNNVVRFLPELNVNRKNNRMTLRHGPGCDYIGPIPIPQELLLKRNQIGEVNRKEKQNLKTSNVLKRKN